MVFDFSIQNQFTQAQMHSVSTFSQSSNIGTLLGQQVQMVASPTSLLADAAEELTFAIDTTDKFELEERKERERDENVIKKRVEMYKELMHEMGKSQKIDILKDSLRTKENKEQILQEAYKYFSDLTDTWASLKSIDEEFKNDFTISEKTKLSLFEAIQELEKQHSDEIKTGLHGALSYVGFEILGSSDDTKNLYQQIVFDFTNVTNAFKYIQENYGNVSFDKAMDFLFSTISADIASDNPSMDRVHLEYIHQNLGNIRLLQSTFSYCEELIGRWENVHNVTTNKLTAMELLTDIVALRDVAYLGVMHIEAIADKAKAPDIEREVLFIQDLANMIKKCPNNLFADVQKFQKVIDIIQQTLDKAIEREDEYLASME